MFRVSLLWRGVSPFTLFLMDQKNNPALKGCAISKRGRILSKMYKKLSQNQRRELKQRAARHPTLPKQTRKQREDAASVARGKKKGKFAKFVHDNYHKVKKLNYRKRFSALSQLYDVSKPLDIEKEVAKALPKAAAKAGANAKKKVKEAVKAGANAKKKVKEAVKAGANAKKKVKETVKAVVGAEKKVKAATGKAKKTSSRKKIKATAKKITHTKV